MRWLVSVFVAIFLIISLLLANHQQSQIYATEGEKLPPQAGAAAPQGSPTTVQLVQGMAYVDALLQALAGAEERVEVMLFSCVLPENPRANHPVRQILDALIAAQRRGLQVRVLFDEELLPDGSRDTFNDVAANYLAKAGVSIHRDEGDVRTHTKTVVIDGHWTLLGSANWTWSAFHRNREHSVVIHDRALSQELSAAFAEAWALSKPHPVP